MKRISVVLTVVLLLLVSCRSTNFHRISRDVVEPGGVNNSETEQALKELYIDEGVDGVLREVNLGTYTEIDVQGYLGDEVYRNYLNVKEEVLNEDELETVTFIKEETSDGTKCYKSETDIEGFYCSAASEKGKVSIEVMIIGSDLYIELKEDGEEKPLSSIKSLSDEYTVSFYANNSKTGYFDLQDYSEGVLCRNEDNIYNTIKIEGANWLLKDVHFELIEISNDDVSYVYLFRLESSCIESILYDMSAVTEAESLASEEKYEEAISLLSNFEDTDYCSFKYYECDSIIETYKETLYQKALKRFLVGDYDEALSLASGHIMSYKDTMRLIKECKKALGMTGVGSVISFGGNWGEPIDWLVLEVVDDRELIISYDIMFDMAYNESKIDITWENCSLREFLNDDSSGFLFFYFTDEEKERIVEVVNSTDGNEFFETDGGNMTNDKVFLLSSEEVLKYFSHDYESSAMKGKAVSTWWTRSPGYSQYRAEKVAADSFSWFLNEVVSSESGVRPAMWITLDD